jgi:hypothetical protein
MAYTSTKVSDTVTVACEDKKCGHREEHERDKAGHFKGSRGLSHTMRTGHTVTETRTVVTRIASPDGIDVGDDDLGECPSHPGKFGDH